MKQRRTKQILWSVIGLILALLVVLVLAKVYAIIMISPDDIGYEKIMSGKTSGVPDGHAYFLRYPLSAGLALLYSLWAGISWYQVFLLGSLVLCMTFIFDRVGCIAKERKLLYLLIAVLSVVILFAAEIVHLEWTVISGILGATALFRFVTMPSEMKKGQCIWEYGVCATFLTLCFSLRNTVAYMFIPLAGLCWLRRLLLVILSKDPEKKKKIIRLAVFLLVCLFLVGAVMLGHRLGYSSEEWKAYQDYTKDRSALFDYYGYPNYDTYEAEYQAAGISREAYNLMRSDYNFVVPCDNFEDMDLKAIADLARSIYKEDKQVKLEQTWETINDILIGEKYLLLNITILVLVICNFIAYKDKKVIDVLFIAGAFCWIWAMTFYLAYDGRIPERVVKCLDYGLILVLAGNLVSFWQANGQIKRLTGTKTVISILLVLALGATVAQSGRKLQEKNKQQATLALAHMEVVQYCAANPDNLYLRDFWSFSQRGQFFMNVGYAANNYQSTGGWTYHSPVYDDMLEKWDCYDLYSAIAENENIYYLVADHRLKNCMNRLNAFFAAEKLPIRTKIVDQYKTVKEDVYVLKFVRCERWPLIWKTLKRYSL